MAYTDVEWKFKSIGHNVTIGKSVYFRYPELVSIGNNVIIDEFCYFTTAVWIGDNVHIGPHCSCIGGKGSALIMGDFSGMAAGVRLICASDNFMHGLTGPTIPAKYRPLCPKGGAIELEKHSLLGTGTVVHPNVVIHEGAATGSLSLVLDSLEAWTINYGIPARPKGERDKQSILNAEYRYRRGEDYATI